MIHIHDVYRPLYTDTKHPIILITGGRASGKSTAVSTFINDLTFEYNKKLKKAHNILFTRYTMVSAGISIIPEVVDKINIDGLGEFFKQTKTEILNKMTGSKILFRGINTSSGNQTAKLKSIAGVTTFVVDEAEEFTSYDDFEKIFLSMRQKGLQIRAIIIMNPTDSNHWVYQKYIKDTHKVVEYDGVPVQISTHPDVLHIHTSYLDNLDFLSETFIDSVRKMKAEDPERYAHVVMGRWSDVAEGAVFKKFGLVDEFPSYANKVARAVDFGYTHDPTGIVRCGIVDNRLYIDELCYRTHLTSGDLIREFREEEERGDDGFIYSESADPRLIDEIALGGQVIFPVQKGPGSIKAGLSKMLDMEVFVTKRSLNLQEELRNYTWQKDKDGNFINEPIDDYNHLIDAARYYVLAVLLGKVQRAQNISKYDFGIL
jgi:phage terminase large subunit